MIDKRQFVTRVTEWENHQNWTTFESKIYKGKYQKRLICNPFIGDHELLKNSKGISLTYIFEDCPALCG